MAPQLHLRLLSSLLALCLAGGQPILPSLSYPVFVLPGSPLDTSFSTKHPASLSQSHPDSISDGTNFQHEDEGFDVTQFHSQDVEGRVVFGFRTPEQTRMESRSADGSVRGSYSYIDPYGNIVKMQYWDNGNGMQMRGTAVPAFTPEVAAARDQHLKLFQATLDANQGYPSLSDVGHDYDEGGVEVNGLGDSGEGDAPVWNQDHKPDLLSRPFIGDDKESVSLDNPDYLGGGFQGHRQEEERHEEENVSGDRVEGEVDLGDVADDVPEEEEEPVEEEKQDGQEEAEDRKDVFYDAEPAENRGTTSKQKNSDGKKPLNIGGKKSGLASAQKNWERVQDENLSFNMEPFNPPRAFFYKFQHTIPKPVERIDMAESVNVGVRVNPDGTAVPSLSERAAESSVPEAAVHDSQVSPIQAGPLVYISPQSTGENAALRFQGQGDAIHDAQVSPLQRQTLGAVGQDHKAVSISRNAAAGNSAPVSAIHDSQVSPVQGGGRIQPDLHQYLPVFIPEAFQR